MVKKSIFHAYDIRGVFPNELNEQTAFKLGAALAKKFSGSIILGRDVRTSSPNLYEALFLGLAHAGAGKINFIPVGIITTPMLYFLHNYLGASLAIMITASHNPKEYNGFKIIKKGIKGSEPVYPLDIYAQVKLIKMPKSLGNFSGLIPKINTDQLFKTYIRFLTSFADIKKPLTIVFDCSNGASALVLPKLIKALERKKIPLKTILINSEPDGNFPAHGPNPMLEGALDDLSRAVVKYKADIGVAYDADADRAFFVDNQGEKIDPNKTLLLLAQNFSGPIIVDSRIGFLVREELAKQGRAVLDERVGSVFIKERLKKTGFDFAGELSGHFYFKDIFNIDSAIFATIVMLNSISRLPSSISDYLSSLPKFYQSGEINFSLSSKADQKTIIKKVALHFKSQAKKISRLDGIKLEFNSWWLSLRASQNEPLLRLNLEAKSALILKKQLAIVKKLIKTK